MHELIEVCPECGNRSFTRKFMWGKQYFECEYCEYISGDDAIIEIFNNMKEAENSEIEISIYPLVRTLNSIKGIRTFESCAGHPEVSLRPYVDFHIFEHFERLLTNLVTSLNLCNRETSRHWYLEPFIHTTLAFTLKPFVPVESDDLINLITEAQNDITIIERNLKMHRNLSWWRK